MVLVAWADVDWCRNESSWYFAGMKTRAACVLLLLTAGFIANAQSDLPESDDYESFEVEPPALLPNVEIDAAKSSGSSIQASDSTAVEKKVERAKRAAADAELLFKRGVLSRMEVELR